MFLNICQYDISEVAIFVTLFFLQKINNDVHFTHTKHYKNVCVIYEEEATVIKINNA